MTHPTKLRNLNTNMYATVSQSGPSFGCIVRMCGVRIHGIDGKRVILGPIPILRLVWKNLSFVNKNWRKQNSQVKMYPFNRTKQYNNPLGRRKKNSKEAKFS